MKDLINFTKIINEIALTLAQDERICSLLINDTMNALTNPSVPLSLNDLIEQHYICIYPPVENRIEEYGRNTFMTLLLDTIYCNQTDNNMTGNIIIYVSTNEAHLLLNNNKNRLLELCNQVAHLIDGFKFSSASVLSLISCNHVMLSEFHSAYCMNFRIADQNNNRKAEI